MKILTIFFCKNVKSYGPPFDKNNFISLNDSSTQVYKLIKVKKKPSMSLL